jgi:hypothetical protein
MHAGTPFDLQSVFHDGSVFHEGRDRVERSKPRTFSPQCTSSTELGRSRPALKLAIWSDTARTTGLHAPADDQAGHPAIVANA